MISAASAGSKRIMLTDSYGKPFYTLVKVEEEISISFDYSEEFTRIRKPQADQMIDITSMIKPENEVDDLDPVVKNAIKQGIK
jgi:hypothetical protein